MNTLNIALLAVLAVALVAGIAVAAAAMLAFVFAPFDDKGLDNWQLSDDDF